MTAAAAAYGKNEVAPEVVKHADLAAAFLSVFIRLQPRADVREMVLALCLALDSDPQHSQHVYSEPPHKFVQTPHAIQTKRTCT